MNIKIQKFSEGNATQVELLGGKGANLAEMCALGLNIPKGYTITTEACVEYLTGSLDKELLIHHVRDTHIEVFPEPTLVSVRSGARISMAGMMDTVLNVGLTDNSLNYWKDRLGERAALDSYRRLIQMFGTVVKGVPNSIFSGILESFLDKESVGKESELSVDAFETIVSDFKDAYKEQTGEEFPNSVEEQLEQAIFAVFDSWNTPRAVEFRKINSIPDDWGTAVNIQQMVFGNMNDQSGSGVLFTRNPSTGGKAMMGEFLHNCQGEDVVSGSHTPRPIFCEGNGGKLEGTMEEWDKDIVTKLHDIGRQLELHYGEAQDIEFTVESGILYILQTRTAKRTKKAHYRILWDMSTEGIKTKDEIYSSVTYLEYLHSKVVKVSEVHQDTWLTQGLPAGGGVVSGKIEIYPDQVTEDSILVRPETTPDDIKAMNISKGILTITGGATSHAAVVARGLGTPCVVGCSQVKIMFDNGKDVITLAGQKINNGDVITIDGDTGKVWLGAVDLETDSDEYLDKIVSTIHNKVTYGIGTSECEAINGKLYIPVTGSHIWENGLPDVKNIILDFGAAYLSGFASNLFMLSEGKYAIHLLNQYLEWGKDKDIKSSIILIDSNGNLDHELLAKDLSTPDIMSGKYGLISDNKIKEVFGTKAVFKKIKKSADLKVEELPNKLRKFENIASVLA